MCHGSCGIWGEGESRISGCRDRDSREKRRNGGEMEKAWEWHVGTGVQHAWRSTWEKVGIFLEGPSKISFCQFLGTDHGVSTHKKAVAKKIHANWRWDKRQFPVAGDQVRNCSATTDEIANQQAHLGPGEFNRELISSNYFQRIGWKTPNTDCV